MISYQVMMTVINCIAEQAGIDKECIHPNNRLKEDLELDSLDMIEIVMYIEDELKIEINDQEENDYLDLNNVYDVIAMVERYYP